MRGNRLAFCVAALVALAGCTGESGTSADATGPATTSMSIDPNLDYAAVVGVVTDDSQTPLAGVQLQILESTLNATTDEAGAFRFAQVPLGKHSLAANKAGYESKVSIVDVQLEAENRVTFLLTAIAVQAPFTETFHHTLRHVAGSLLVDALAGSYGLPTCEGCKWTQKTDGINEAVILEITGTHSVASPLGPAKEYVEIQKNKPFVLLASGIHALPAKLTIASAVLTDTQDFLFYGACDPDWMCLDEKREFWFSAFHFAAPPADYSALPKE